MFTSVEDRVWIQIELLTTFLKGGGQLWAFEDFWTQVRIFTGKAASTFDFNWSLQHINVSIWSRFQFVTYF